MITYCRKPGFHLSYMRHRLARLTRSLTFASARPQFKLCLDGHTLGFHRFGARRLRHKVLLVHTKRVDARLLPEHGPDLISGTVTMDDVTFTTFLPLTRGTSAISWFHCRALLDTASSQSFIRYGCTSSPMRQYNAMSSLAGPNQLDALLIALKSLPRGTWSALTIPHPHGPLHGLYDPRLRQPEPLELFRFFGLTNNPPDGIQRP